MNTTFLKHFDSITDPRIERCKKHSLLDILLLAISAVISGAEGWEDIEDFGRLKLDWLRKYRPLEAGIPKHDTIARVICRLKANEIEPELLYTVEKRMKGDGVLTENAGIVQIRDYANHYQHENLLSRLAELSSQLKLAKLEFHDLISDPKK
jgi:hypothetical protein